MKAANLLSDVISPVVTSDKGNVVIAMMNIYQVRHLPIVNNEQLLGVISEEDILSQDIDAPIGSYTLSMRRPFVHDFNNVFDMMKILAEYGLTLIPVVDSEDNYLGVVLQEDIIKYFSQSTTFIQPGAVLFITMNTKDYSLVELSSIIESENAAILGLFLYEHHDDPKKLTLTVKLNKSEVQHIISSLRRYQYVVEASFTLGTDPEGFKDRYDSLMHYLDM